MPAIPEADWMQPAAQLMAQEGISLREAATRLRIPLTNEVAATTYRLKIFQKLLRQERNRFAMEVANDPAWTKRTAIGQMLACVQHLMEAGEFDKALEGLLKVARVEGWTNSEANINVFAGLTDRELADVKGKIAARTNGPGAEPIGKPLA